MAKKVINIGTTGNDATGDSIREGFKKVNENFTEIYAAIGLGGGLTFESLDNTPNSLTGNKIYTSDASGSNIVERTLEGVGIGVDFTSDPTKVLISNTGTELRLDSTPQLGNDLDAQSFLIENLGAPQKPGDAVNRGYADATYINTDGDTATGVIQLKDGSNPRIPTLDAEIVNKQYADTKVPLVGGSMTGPLFLSETPQYSDPPLQAATKQYVDQNSFTTENNIFVSTKGRTEAEMLAGGITQNVIGRSQSYAFKTVREACFYAERILKGDITLKEQGLLPASHEVYWRVPGRKPGPYTINQAADGTEDLTNVIANNLLTKNRTFVQQETLAWIEREIADGDNTDSFATSFTFNRDKCYRDIGLIIDAVSFDLTYVGNSKTVDAAKSYWDGATSRVAGQQSETVAAINFARDLVLNYILTNTAYPSLSVGLNPYAVALINANKEFVIDETIAYINAQIATNAGIWAGFTYDEAKCARDLGIILDGIVFDIQYGGNTKTRHNAALYWDGATSQVAGQQQQTIAASNFAKNLVTDYILLNQDWTSLQTAVFKTFQTKTANNGESQARFDVETLMDDLADVIVNGLGNLPSLVGTRLNTSGVVQYIDTSAPVEPGASTTVATLMNIVTSVITSGLGAAPAKVGGQGREQNIPAPEITIFVESGVYEELLPIVVPENTSLKGDEQRRVVIQPILGVRPPSRSLNLKFERGDIRRYDGTGTPQAARFRNHYDSQYSQADTSVGINTVGNASVRLKNLVYYPKFGQYFEWQGVRYYIKNFSFDPDGFGDFTRADIELFTDPNLAFSTQLQHDIPNNTVIELKLLNQHCDMFLVNNATILRNATYRRCQGFHMVLDPEGQILTKSPYVQVASVFAGQGGGGQLVDGNAGVQYGVVVDNPATGTSITLTGLTRTVQIPTTILYQGLGASEKKTYRIIGATAAVDDGTGNGTFKSTLTLANDTQIVTDAKSLPTGNIPQGEQIRIETAGNKSMTSNDYTNVNSDGYGLVATNAGLVETVSVFTYYCDIAYWARNGGQIRSLNGSNAYGRVALQAEGSNPNENVQSGQVFYEQLNAYQTGSPDLDGTTEVTIHNPDGSEALTGQVFLNIRDIDYLPFANSRFILTPFSSNNDGTVYEIDEVEENIEIITAVSISSTAVVTTQDNHYYRNGSVIRLFGLDGNGMVNTDGVYYCKVVGAKTFEVYTDANLTNGLDTTSKGNPSYSGSGGQVFGGGRCKLNLGQALSIGVGTDVPDGARIKLTIGKKIKLKNLVDTPRVLPSSAMQYATGNQEVYRILGIDRRTAKEPGGDVDFQELLFDLVIPPDRTANETVKVTTQISTLRATGHDFLNIGWGNYVNSNYPNNVFGAPAGRPDFSSDQASEAVELGAGRVFYASTDQDGNFRVGRFFRVNQGDGSVELNANISLTNVDGLGFTKGTVVDEFSTDDKMQGKSDDAVPTEASVVTYLNSTIVGRHEDGTSITNITSNGAQKSTTQGGLLARDGWDSVDKPWNKMQGTLNLANNIISNIQNGTNLTDGVNKNYTDNVFRGDFTGSIRTDVKGFTMLNDSTLDTGAIDMNGNRIKSLREPEDGTDAVNKDYVDVRNIFGELQGVTISGNPNNTDLVMFNGVNTTDGFGNPINGIVNVALDTTTDTTPGSPTFGEPSGTGSDIRITRIGNSINVQFATGSVKNADVSTNAQIAQSKLAMNAATTRANSTGITQSDLGLASFHNTQFSSTNGFVQLATPTSLSQTLGVPISKLSYVTGNSILGNPDVSNNAVQALTPAQIRTIISFDASVESYLTENVLQSNGGITVSGGTLTGTLVTNGGVPALSGAGIRPATNEVGDIGNSTARYNDVYSKTFIATNIKEADTSTDLTFKGANDTVVLKISDGVVTGLPALTPTANLGTTTTYENSVFIGKARRLETPRTISISGGMVGSATFDGSENISISVAPSVAVGDPLDGTYVRKTGISEGSVLSGTLGVRSLLPSSGITGAGVFTNVRSDNTYDIGHSETFNVLSVTGATQANPCVITTGTAHGATDGTQITINNVSGMTELNGNTYYLKSLSPTTFELYTNFGLTNGVDSTVFTSYVSGGTATWSNNDANRFATIHAVTFQGTATAARFADLAENYRADDNYEPGTVLMFGGQKEVTISTGKATTKVAGIVSTDPAYLMNSGLIDNHVVSLALQGRVPCKVIGKISKGDMLVASDIDGVATAASSSPKLGTIIGKSLMDYDSKEVGVIEVVVGRQ
jgi:hypothetical protein